MPSPARVTDTCPTWPTLLAWLENDLPDEDSQRLNTQLADCEECRERLVLMNADAVKHEGTSGLSPHGENHRCSQTPRSQCSVWTTFVSVGQLETKVSVPPLTVWHGLWCSGRPLSRI